MALSASSYPLSRGTGTCAATGQPIPPGTPCIAALVEVMPSSSNPADAGRPRAPVMTRQDFGLDAWNSGKRPTTGQLFGFWKTLYQPAVKPRKHLLDDDALLEVFETLSEASDAKQIKFRYLLTLLLVRRRLLRVVATRTSQGVRTMHVLRRGEPDAVPMTVIDPGLDELSIADAMESLAQLIDVDVDGSSPPDSPPAP